LDFLDFFAMSTTSRPGQAGDVDDGRRRLLEILAANSVGRYASQRLRIIRFPHRTGSRR
jgi:hypothetical protein